MMVRLPIDLLPLYYAYCHPSVITVNFECYEEIHYLPHFDDLFCSLS